MELEKSIGILGGVGLIVGTIIGSGIFLSPSSVFIKSGSIGLSLIIWIISGVISLLGALCYAELGTTIQRSGAEYAYLFEAFGPLAAFLFSWTGTLVIRPSAGAIITIIFGQYVSQPFYKEEEAPEYIIKLTAFICIVVIVIVNCASVRLAVAIQGLFTVAKLACIVLLIIVGCIELAKGRTSVFSNFFNGTSKDPGEITLAFYSGLWAYDAWNSLNYVTEEMQSPAKQMPIAITIAMLIVIGCYVLCNVAYFVVLGPDGMAKSTAVALDLARIYLGKGKLIVPILVALSCFGAFNGLLFASGRLVYAAAREKHLPSFLAMIYVRRRTPIPAILLTASISCLMLIPNASRFESLVALFSFASWLFYGLCFVIVIYLRVKRKDLVRPYQVPLLIPIIMVIVSIGLTVLPIYRNLIGSLIAVVFILLGIPAYYICVKFDIVNKVPVFKKGGDLATSMSRHGFQFHDIQPNNEA